MPRIKLTAKAIDKLPVPDPSGKQTIHWDMELKGFGVLCSGAQDSKSKTYIVQHDLRDGRARRITIAPTNVLDLEKARVRAKEILADFYRGVDPKHRSAGAATLRQTLDAYLAIKKGLSDKSREIYTHLITRHLEPWCDRPLRSITVEMVDDMHRTIAADVERGGRYSGRSVANDAMRALRLLWNHAAHRIDDMPRNPVRLRGDEWHRVQPVRRPIRAEQLSNFYAAVCALPSAVGRDFLLLMLFTGLRRREAAGLRWAENIDLVERVIRLPESQTKAGRQLDLPMSDFVHDLLVARRALGDGKFVFPSYGASGHVEDPRAYLDAVHAATGIRFSSHDLRRTFVTVAESADISVMALKALVNHALSKGVTEDYIDMTVERLREPAQRVCDRLRALCGATEPGGGNVRRLKG